MKPATVIFLTMAISFGTWADSHSERHGSRGVVATGSVTYPYPTQVSVRASVNVNTAPYNPYLAYWNCYPTSTYNNGSFGYWSSSNGAYGSSYTQPGLFKSYTYGPYGYSSTYLTPTYGYHTGPYLNFSYSRPSSSGYPFSLTGTGPRGNRFSLIVG